MTLNKLKAEYGTGKYLNDLRVSDFNRYNTLEECVYRGVQVRIEFDYYNHWYLYSSDDVELCGKWCCSLSDLKQYLKSEIKEIKSKGVEIAKS